MESKAYFEIIRNRLLDDCRAVNFQADEENICNNHTRYGAVSAWARVLDDLGHIASVPAWTDENGMLRIPMARIDNDITEFEGGKTDKLTIEDT